MEEKGIPEIRWRNRKSPKKLARKNQEALERRENGSGLNSSENVVSFEEEGILKRADAMASDIITKYGSLTYDRKSLEKMRKYYEVSSEPKDLIKDLAKILLGYQRGVVHRDPSYLVLAARAYRELRQNGSSENEG